MIQGLVSLGKSRVNLISKSRVNDVVSKQECRLIAGVLPALVAVNMLCKSAADNAAVC